MNDHRNRVKIMMIPDSLLLEVLAGEATIQVPEGSMIISTASDYNYRALAITIWNPEFEPVAPSAMIPIMDCIVTRCDVSDSFTLDIQCIPKLEG